PTRASVPEPADQHSNGGSSRTSSFTRRPAGPSVASGRRTSRITSSLRHTQIWLYIRRPGSPAKVISQQGWATRHGACVERTGRTQQKTGRTPPRRATRARLRTRTRVSARVGCEALRFGGDLVERFRDSARPCSGDDSPPCFAELPAVGAQLSLPAKRGPALFRLEQKRLDQIGDGAADEPEVDPAGPFESHGFEGGGGSALDSRVVGRKHHVAAPLPDLQLVGERPRCPAEVGRGDHV